MYVARLLSEALGGGSVESLSGERLRKPSEFEVDADSPSEPVVWVFPTYSWGVPPVVADFIREVSFGKKRSDGAALYGDYLWRRYGPC